MKALRLLRIELTVADLRRAERFYVSALGFESVSAGGSEIVLQRAGQQIALQAFDPGGAPYPADATACDQVFQHFAMPVIDIAAAVARLADVRPISRGGPQHLPHRSGGATAFKFRDPDGHPLELIQFADGHTGGIDHSAIVSTNASRSIAFYRNTLGLDLAAQQLNTGPEQDRLDGLDGVAVEVVALQPHVPTPHLELLAYRSPPVRRAGSIALSDVAATRLVFAVLGCTERTLIADPDGHKLVLVPAE